MNSHHCDHQASLRGRSTLLPVANPLALLAALFLSSKINMCGRQVRLLSLLPAVSKPTCFLFLPVSTVTCCGVSQTTSWSDRQQLSGWSNALSAGFHVRLFISPFSSSLVTMRAAETARFSSDAGQFGSVIAAVKSFKRLLVDSVGFGSKGFVLLSLFLVNTIPTQTERLETFDGFFSGWII